MRVAICEDEENNISRLTAFCESWKTRNPQAGLLMESYAYPEDLLDVLERGQLFDLYFLDIEFDFMNGYELAEAIRSHDSKAVIVFTTNSRNYLQDGYKLDVYRYLLKPVREQDILNCLDHAYQNQLTFTTKWLTIEQKSGGIRIPVAQIVKIECQGHYLIIYTSDGNSEKIRLADTFTAFCSSLPDVFLRINRGTVINLLFVSKFTLSEVYLNGSASVSVIGSTFAEEVHRKLSEYFWGENP